MSTLSKVICFNQIFPAENTKDQFLGIDHSSQSTELSDRSACVLSPSSQVILIDPYYLEIAVGPLCIAHRLAIKTMRGFVALGGCLMFSSHRHEYPSLPILRVLGDSIFLMRVSNGER